MIHIRKAKAKDEKEMTDLWMQLMNIHNEIDPVYYRLENDPQQIFSNWLSIQIKSNSQFIYVAELVKKEKSKTEKHIVGFISGYIKSLFPWFRFKSVGHISFLVVEEKYRKRGIGKQLEAEVIRYLKSKKISYIEVFTNEKNVMGIEAWQSYGYKPFNKFFRKEI